MTLLIFAALFSFLALYGAFHWMAREPDEDLAKSHEYKLMSRRSYRDWKRDCEDSTTASRLRRGKEG
jgi:hypothetical protein